MLGIAHSIYTGKIAEAGAYVTLMMAADKLNQHFYTLFDLFRSWIKLSIYGGRIHEFFTYEDEKEDGNPVESGPLAVELKDVCFHYPNTAFAIQNLNLSIRPGEKIAIVGENRNSNHHYDCPSIINRAQYG